MPSQLAVSPLFFRLVWFSTAVTYLVCGTVLAGYGLLYFFILNFMVGVLYNVELLGVHVQPEVFPYMGAATLTIAVIHFYYLANMLSSSIRTRSLQFPTRGFSGFASRIGHVLAAALDGALPPRSSCVGYTLRAFSGFAVYVWNAFDVTSLNYGVVYFLRELVQTGIQTQQAYQLSAHVASPWMNHTIVFLLVVNCWAMPLIRSGLQIRSTPTARLLCLIINFALDFVSYVAFPIALLVPYTTDFNANNQLDFASNNNNFTKETWYTDVWFIQLINEWPLVFTTSIWDGLSRLFITFSMTRTLRSIAKLLQPQQPHPGPESMATSSPGLHSTSSVVPIQLSFRSKNSFTASLIRLPPVPVLRSRAEQWGHRLLGLWGLVVLLLHVLSFSTETNPRCLLQVRPWFVRRPVCSLMEMNCFFNAQLTGNASDFDATLDSIDSAWLSYLIIRHCPSVEITPHIRDLSWLMGIKIDNSTLFHWDEEAALTQTHHPNMLFALLLSTNVSVFPQALYHHDFPAKLMDIEFSFVNLTEIPTQVVDRWHASMFLVMEGLQLPAFPDVLAKLQPSFLSVACNNFSTIPDAILENPQLLGLILNGNPISELPSGLDMLSTLSIVKTQIVHTPLWFDVSNALYQLQAGTTPLCEALAQRNSKLLGLETETEMELWRQRVNCTPANELRYLSHYPLTDEATNNPSTH